MLMTDSFVLPLQGSVLYQQITGNVGLSERIDKGSSSESTKERTRVSEKELVGCCVN